MDPTYKGEVCERVMRAISKSNVLEENGLIICEHHMYEDMADEVGEFRKTDERKYGKKVVTFYTR